MLTNLKMGQNHDNLVGDKWSHFSTVLTNYVPSARLICRAEKVIFQADREFPKQRGIQILYARYNENQ